MFEGTKVKLKQSVFTWSESWFNVQVCYQTHKIKTVCCGICY